MKSFGIIIFALIFIFIGYQTYTTEVFNYRGTNHQLTYNEKIFTSLFFIFSGLYFFYLAVKSSMKNDKKTKKK